MNTYSLDDDFDYLSQTESEYNSGPRDTSFHVIQEEYSTEETDTNDKDDEKETD